MNKYKGPAIIFDIDGTVADCRHRLHHLPNYQKFFDDMTKDTVITPVVNLAYMIDRFNAHEIIFVSGRPDSHRQETLDWLDHHVVAGPHKLYMRRAGDHRPDYVIKNEIRQEIEKEYDIKLVIDDRPQVVDMWRKAGYVCLQNEWHGDIKPKYKPGKLTVMVGPSGAGKDHWIRSGDGLSGYDGFRSEIVSSDTLRHRLCGDFRDQSKNEQVFSLFHSLVKTTLEHGGNVVANATHIKDKDRLATVACAPKDAEIEYIVIDRPLSDKLRDAGWRKGVQVKGRSLIEHHHQVFQSNLTQILLGDNDPRVAVRDFRV